MGHVRLTHIKTGRFRVEQLKKRVDPPPRLGFKINSYISFSNSIFSLNTSNKEIHLPLNEYETHKWVSWF